MISYVENCQKGLHGYVRDSLTNEPIKSKKYLLIVTMHLIQKFIQKLQLAIIIVQIQNGTYSITYSADGYYSKTINNVSISSNSNE